MIKVLVYYNFSYPLGGGDYLPLTFIRELQNKASVTLAVDSTTGFERALKCFDVQIDRTRLNIVQLMPHEYIAGKHTGRHSFKRNVKLKKLAEDADICISASNVIDFGRPAHHFINFLCGVDKKFTANTNHVRPTRAPIAQQCKHFISEYLLRPLLNMRSKRRIIRDPREHIYPPSAYVRDLMTDFYGPFNGEIFYPPTTFEPLSDNVEKEPLRVVYLGRINPEKRIPDICDIVEKARNLSGKDLKLIIAGPYDKNSAAVNNLLSYIRQRPWISLLDGAFGEEKSKLLHSGTYAVHARRNEEFGISITEYLKAGLIPIVPDEGGSREVVDAPDLTYSDNDMAAKILVRLLTDAEFREQQRRHCAERAKVFSRENYFARQTELLDKILAEAE